MLLLYTAMIDDEQDKLRFEDIYYTYCKQMYLVAMQVLHDHGEAEDAVQNALMGIAKQIKSVPSGNPKIVRAYVLTAARNAALNLLPKREIWERIIDIEEVKVADRGDLFEQVALSQDYDLLLRAVRQIPEPYQDVLMLYFVQELSEKEVAEILGRKQTTVHQQITRGKKLLVAICRKEGMNFAEQEII